MAGVKGRSGKPKTFKSAEELKELWTQFIDEVAENGYVVAPTRTEFSRWLHKNGMGGDRRTIYNALNIYFPEIKAQVIADQADMFVQGAVTNKYHATATIFALKNFCGWRDQVKTEVEVGEETRKALTTAEKMKMIREAVDNYGGES